MDAAAEVLEGAVETLPHEFAILDDSGTIVYTNRRWREFARENDLDGDPSSLGENYLDVCDVAAADDDVVAGEIASGLRALLADDRETFTYEYPCHSPDQHRWFLMYAVSYTVDGDRYVQVSHLDVTGRKESELTVERRNDRLQAVASILSHDLRNPLTVAQGFLDLLADRVEDETISNIRSALTRMETIISDALILARGTDLDRLDPVDLRAAAERAWRNVETDGATLEVTGSTTFEADRSLLGNLFENLFRNAVEHGSTHQQTASADAAEHGSTDEQPPSDDGVTVRVGPLDDGAGFYVADDGPGIPPDVRDSVFETGFTTRRDEGSTGLGLAIVGEIADGHGWTVDLADAETGGTRFEIRGVTLLDD
jgi:signal transduction histidine kinase